MDNPPLRLDDPQSRHDLAQRQAPYWIALAPGLALGYRRGILGGHWLVRMTDRDNDPPRKQIGLGRSDDLRDHGKLEPDGQKILSFAQAQAKAKALFRGVPASHWTDPAEMKTDLRVRDAVENYLGWMERHRTRSWSRTQQMADCHILKSTLAGLPLKTLEMEHIANWHYALAESGKMTRAGRTATGGKRIPQGNAAELETARCARRSTANRVLGVLKAALTFQRKLRRDSTPDPATWGDVENFSDAGVTSERYLTLEEQRKLVDACGPGIQELVEGALVTGARFSELAELKAKDVLLDQGLLRLRHAKQGKNKSVQLPLVREAIAYLRDRVEALKPGDLVFTKADGSSWGRNHHSRPFKACLVTAGLEPMRFHELRHSFAVTQLQLGTDPHLVAQALGHTSLVMLVKHYSPFLGGWANEPLRLKSHWTGVTSRTRMDDPLLSPKS
jgi:integrase